MAFSLTKAYLYKVDTPSHIRKRGFQVAEFHITRVNTDTALDLGNITGTFWTAVGAEALGAAVLPFWRQALIGLESLVEVNVTTNTGYMLRVASAPSASQFTLANSGTFPECKPSLTLNSGGGPVTLRVVITCTLAPETHAVEYGV